MVSKNQVAAGKTDQSASKQNNGASKTEEKDKKNKGEDENSKPKQEPAAATSSTTTAQPVLPPASISQTNQSTGGGGGGGGAGVTIVQVGQNNDNQTSGNNNNEDPQAEFEPPPMPWGYKFFHLWLPRLHLVSAWTLLILNLLVPGLGTIIFSFKWLGFSDYAFEAPLSIRCRIAMISLACGISQLVLTPVIFGWGFAVLTGLMAVQQAYWIAAIEDDEQYWYDNGYNEDEEGNNNGADTTENVLGTGEQGATTRRPRRTDGEKGELPGGRMFGPKRKYKVPPGWVYRLYPGFIDQPQTSVEQDAAVPTGAPSGTISNQAQVTATTAKAKTPAKTQQQRSDSRQKQSNEKGDKDKEQDKANKAKKDQEQQQDKTKDSNKPPAQDSNKL